MAETDDFDADDTALDTSDTDTEFFSGTDGYGADDLASEDRGEPITSDEARAIMRESEAIREPIRRGLEASKLDGTTKG